MRFAKFASEPLLSFNAIDVNVSFNDGGTVCASDGSATERQTARRLVFLLSSHRSRFRVCPFVDTGR